MAGRMIAASDVLELDVHLEDLGGDPPGLLAPHGLGDAPDPSVEVEVGARLQPQEHALSDRHLAAVGLVHHGVGAHLA